MIAPGSSVYGPRDYSAPWIGIVITRAFSLLR